MDFYDVPPPPKTLLPVCFPQRPGPDLAPLFSTAKQGPDFGVTLISFPYSLCEPRKEKVGLTLRERQWRLPFGHRSPLIQGCSEACSLRGDCRALVGSSRRIDKIVAFTKPALSEITATTTLLAKVAPWAAEHSPPWLSWFPAPCERGQLPG